MSKTKYEKVKSLEELIGGKIVDVDGNNLIVDVGGMLVKQTVKFPRSGLRIDSGNILWELYLNEGRVYSRYHVLALLPPKGHKKLTLAVGNMERHKFSDNFWFNPSMFTVDDVVKLHFVNMHQLALEVALKAFNTGVSCEIALMSLLRELNNKAGRIHEIAYRFYRRMKKAIKQKG